VIEVRQNLIPNRVDIKFRVQIVEEKSRIDNFKADTVIGADRKGLCSLS